ncbi:MAG TPA: GAF domain-containing SpoIIE family protein phosphatase [Chthoniobacteraceae bacterium]|nr:GAF domain-containing SpoIIE family protein phosphatase [Chthoniobacteraceae bacterium]
MSSILFGLLMISWAVGIFFYRRHRERVADLQLALEKLQIEESRMFDFLHELGAAFSDVDDLRPDNLHGLLVDAAMHILGAHGGALYVANRSGKMLLPAYISKGCPPLLEVPAHILAQAEQNPVALQSYLRRHPVARGEGVLGTVWKEQSPVLLFRQDPRLAMLRDITVQTGSVMIVPLVYVNHRLGVLALANAGMGRNFTASDFNVFKAICDQAAFALYSASIYSEASEKRRLDHDLTLAQEIQRILLPSEAPEVPGYELCGINRPASHVGGDYYDYLAVDADHTGVAIADVSGKGIPAALIMATCRSVLRSTAPGAISAAEVLHRVNRQMYPDLKEDMFISMAYILLNHHSNRVDLCRAGHDAPLHYSARKQTVTRINPPGMAVGIDRGSVFDRIAADFSVTLEPDDCLILYTDGVTEALDAKGNEFGMKNMIQSIQASAAGGASAIVAQLTDDLSAYIGSTPQNDDITLIVIRKT